MYTLLPPMEPQKRPEYLIPSTEVPLTKHQLVRDYLLKTSSNKKDSYYVDINPQVTHNINAPIQKPKREGKNCSTKPPIITEKFKTTITQTSPSFQDHDYPSPTRNTKKNTTSHKKKPSSPKASEKKVTEIESAEKEETGTEVRNPKLKEICFIKNSFGKQLIAKYNSKNDKSDYGEDNLIIVWNEQNKAQLLTYRGKDPRRYAMGHCLPLEKSAFRVHDFTATKIRKSGGSKKLAAKRRKARN